MDAKNPHRESTDSYFDFFFRVLFFLPIDESKSYHEFLSGFIIFFSHSFLFLLFLLSARTPPLHNCSQALKMLFFRFRQTFERKGKGRIIKIGGKWVWVWRYHSIIVQPNQTETERVKYALVIEKGLWFSARIIIFCVLRGENVENMVTHSHVETISHWIETWNTCFPLHV